MKLSLNFNHFIKLITLCYFSNQDFENDRNFGKKILNFIESTNIKLEIIEIIINLFDENEFFYLNYKFSPALENKIFETKHSINLSKVFALKIVLNQV